MRKLIGILALIMILCLAIAMPGLAVKIAPYSQPLHDIVHWDAKNARLIIQNPEGESLTVSWPATVDLMNYDGNTWTFDLPDGNKFAFLKETRVTITDPLAAGNAVYGYINSTDAVGWSAGEVVAVRGEAHLATLNPGMIVSSFGGKFTLELDEDFTAVGAGMTAGAYVGVENQYGGSAPCAVLYIEDITSGDGDQGNMPVVIITSQGDAGDKSQYAFSFGFAAAGTTVSTNEDADAAMIRTGGGATNDTKLFQGIQVIVNGAAYYIPLILATDWVDD